MKKINSCDEIEKIKTSDEESGVFLYSEKAYEIFRSIVWKGEKGRKSETKKGVAILILNMIYSKKKNKDDFKYISSSNLKDIFDDYKKILKELSDFGLITIVKSTTTKYFTNPNYVGRCKISEEDHLLYKKSWKKYNEKLEKRGYKSNTSNFTFDIDEVTLKNIVENTLYTYTTSITTKEEAVKDQIRRVKNLKNGNLKPKQKSYKRCDSQFTGLIKELHPFLKINNQNVVEIDSHATFLTFLPTICKKWITKLEYDIQQIMENEKFNIDDLDAINRINKKRELIEGAAEEVKSFDEFLYNTFQNNESIYEVIARNIEGYELNKIKKSMNSYLMSQDCTKVDRNIDLFFKTNFPKIRELLNDMRQKNKYWSTAEKIEVSIFTETAIQLKKLGIHCITKFDGILVEKSRYVETLRFLHNSFENKQINSIFNIIDHENNTKIKLNSKKRIEIIEIYEKDQLELLLNGKIENISSFVADASPISEFVPLSSKSSTHIDIRQGQGQGQSIELRNFPLAVQNSSLAVQNSSLAVQRSKTFMITTLKDGRFRISIKDRKYNSRKNESKTDFYKRLMNDVEISDENKNLIIFGELDQRENIETSVASVDVSQNDSKTIFGEDLVETVPYIEISRNSLVKPPRDVYESLDIEKIRIYKNLIEGGL